MKIAILLILILGAIDIEGQRQEVTVYDCESPHAQQWKISANEIGLCPEFHGPIPLKATYTQIISRKKAKDVTVLRCHLTVRTEGRYCGAYGHLAGIHDLEDEHTMEVPMDTCQEIYRTQYYQPIPGNKQLFHIPHGVKKKFHMVTLGSRSDDASCSGSTYTHKVGSTSKELKHRVIIKYFSLLVEKMKSVQMEGVTKLPLAKQSDPNARRGFDSEIGSWYIEGDQFNKCNYEEVYSGIAFVSDEQPKEKTFLMLNSTTQTLALRLGASTHSCEGLRGFKTQDPDMIVTFPTTKAQSLDIDVLKSLNVNLNSLVSLSDQFVLSQLQRSQNTLVAELNSRFCNETRETREIELFLLKSDPIKAAALHFGRGYIIDLRGDAIIITKCFRTTAVVRQTPNCHKDLGITFRTKNCFRDSNTWAIIPSSTQVDCFGEYSYFDVNGIWFKSVPELVPLTGDEKPKIVQPGYKNLSSSVEVLPHTIGVYSGEVSNGIFQSLLYPILRLQAIDTYTNQYMRTTNGFLDERMNRGITSEDGIYNFLNGLLDEVWIGLEYYAKICLAAVGVAYLTWQVLWWLIGILKTILLGQWDQLGIFKWPWISFKNFFIKTMRRNNLYDMGPKFLWLKAKIISLKSKETVTRSSDDHVLETDSLV